MGQRWHGGAWMGKAWKGTPPLEASVVKTEVRFHQKRSSEHQRPEAREKRAKPPTWSGAPAGKSLSLAPPRPPPTPPAPSSLEQEWDQNISHILSHQER